MGESITPPKGFRFSPFEEELISFYLKPKVLGQTLPCNVVEERQLYGPNANPWQVFDPEQHSWILSEATPGKFEKVTYVFVNLTKLQSGVERKKKGGRDNYIKKAGCGTWGGKTSRNEIRDSSSGDLIGEKRMLVFEINEDALALQDLSKVGYWKMHEFHLRGVNQDISNPRNTVLCKITFDSSKKPPVKSCTKLKDDHQIVTSLPTMNNGVIDGSEGVSDTCGEETEIIDIREAEECINSDCVEENTLLTASSPSELHTDYYRKPVSSDFCWPAYGDDYKKLRKEEQTVEDTATNLRKRKLKIETSCAATDKLKPVSSDFCWPSKHDIDYQKIKEEAGGGRGDLHSSSYSKPKEEQSVEDIEVETPCMMAKNLSPSIQIID